ncbi:MAG: VOC family protein [Gemmatimonadaceae bacterium]
MSPDPAVPGNAGDGAEPEHFVANTLSASLTVNDIPKSLAWYRDVLGFTVAREFERDGKMFAVSLRAGSVPILITQDDGAKGTGRTKGEGISLQLTTSQNVDAIAARIKAAGFTLASEPADARGARVFRVLDPDGFKLVISSERAP